MEQEKGQTENSEVVEGGGGREGKAFQWVKSRSDLITAPLMEPSNTEYLE